MPLQKGRLISNFLNMSKNFENWASIFFFWNLWGKGKVLGIKEVELEVLPMLDFNFSFSLDALSFHGTSSSYGGSSSSSLIKGVDSFFPLLKVTALHTSFGFLSGQLGNLPFCIVWREVAIWLSWTSKFWIVLPWLWMVLEIAWTEFSNVVVLDLDSLTKSSIMSSNDDVFAFPTSCC